MWDTFIEINNKLYDEIKKISSDIEILKKYFTEMGSLTQAMQNILTDSVEKNQQASELITTAILESSRYFKYTRSEKYDSNLIEEWFYDMLVDIIATNSERKHVENWMKSKISMARVNKIKKHTLEEQIKFYNTLIKEACNDFKLKQSHKLAMEYALMIYTSMYFLIPFQMNPLYKKYKDLVNKME